MAPLSVLPGRLRLECEAIRGQRGMCSALERGIGALAGVLEVTANFRTGRLLVHFDEGVIARTELSGRIDGLLRSPERCGGCECPEAGAQRAAGRPAPSAHGGRNVLLDLLAHAVLPRPFDLLVPALSALRR